MNSAIHPTSVLPIYEATQASSYLRACAYWLGASVVICSADQSWPLKNWTSVWVFMVVSPGLIVVLTKLSIALRRCASARTLRYAPDLEFSRRAALAFHATRAMLIACNLACALLAAKLLFLLLRN